VGRPVRTAATADRVTEAARAATATATSGGRAETTSTPMVLAAMPPAANAANAAGATKAEASSQRGGKAIRGEQDKAQAEQEAARAGERR